MNKPASQPTVINVSVRIYAVLLMLYPASYRNSYGNDMIQLFQDVARDSYQRRGIIGMLFWWGSTVLDLIFTAIEQRKEGKNAMSKAISVKPIKGTGLDLMCILGGIIYLLGGIWLLSAGLPTDSTSIQGTHLLRMMWAGGATCGLMGMAVTGAIDSSLTARAAAWLSGFSFVILGIDALNALVFRYPIPAYNDSALPFSSAFQVIPLIGWVVLTVLVTNGKGWTGWSKFAPLVMLFAPFVGLLLGGLLGLKFLPLVVMGLGLVFMGFAVQINLAAKRRIEIGKAIA